MTRIFVFTFLLLYGLEMSGQNTLGVLAYDSDLSLPGYNLFFTHNQSTVYLIDACGEITHSWTDDEDFRPGNAVYLLPNGNLVKCKRRNNSIEGDPIWAGGGGETIEVRSWDNDLISSITLNDSIYRLHHDVAPMPNGNILAIAWKAFPRDTVISLGRLSTDVLDKLWTLSILEWDPFENNIVWEWNAIDHVIQELDPELENFGDVSSNPQKIDINYYLNDLPDWLHTNAIDYNPVLDQIVVSVPYFDELWIIDHSADKDEVKTSSGGNAGFGGDLIYRWGNAQTYQNGSDLSQKLFFQHDVHWIDPLAEVGDPDFGKLMLYNNQLPGGISTVNTILTPVDSFSYVLDETGRFGPLDFESTFIHPDSNFMAFSGLVSSAQKLSNGNIFTLSGRWGFAYEVTPQNEIAWEYKIPLSVGQPASQGDSIGIGDNLTFKMTRYPLDYPAFEGKDLSPKGYLEMNPNETYCAELTDLYDFPISNEGILKVFPNPTTGILNIEFDFEDWSSDITIYDINGLVVFKENDKSGKQSVDLGAFPPGIYLLKVGESSFQKVVKF